MRTLPNPKESTMTGILMRLHVFILSSLQAGAGMRVWNPPTPFIRFVFTADNLPRHSRKGPDFFLSIQLLYSNWFNYTVTPCPLRKGPVLFHQGGGAEGVHVDIDILIPLTESALISSSPPHHHHCLMKDASSDPIFSFMLTGDSFMLMAVLKSNDEQPSCPWGGTSDWI